MKLAAVVVTYHPNEGEVTKNILSYANGIDLLIVYDNSEMPKYIPPVTSTTTYHIAKGKNIGLASAYNRAIEIALQNDCSHIMTMDQDSQFENFCTYRNAMENARDHGMFCPPINNPLGGVIIFEEVPNAAQSGCVFSLEMISKIGKFRDDFFISMVDVEMQLRAIEHGYHIMQCTGKRINLIHHIGSERSISFCGKTFSVSDYNPLRHYYDSRNRILMWHEFPQDYTFRGKIRHLRGRLSVMARILIAEDRKWVKIKAIISGTVNGLFNRTMPY